MTRANRASGSGLQVSIRKPGRQEQLVHTGAVVLAADLRPDRFALGKRHQSDSWNPDLMLQRGNQVHLDPVVDHLIEGPVLEHGGIEVGAQLMVEHQEHVAVELGGDSLRIVVRRFNPAHILAQVHAQKQPVVLRHRLPHPAQEADGGRRVEVADGAAEERVQGGMRQSPRPLEAPRRCRRPQARPPGRDTPDEAARRSGSGSWR